MEGLLICQGPGSGLLVNEIPAKLRRAWETITHSLSSNFSNLTVLNRRRSQCSMITGREFMRSDYILQWRSQKF